MHLGGFLAIAQSLVVADVQFFQPQEGHVRKYLVQRDVVPIQTP